MAARRARRIPSHKKGRRVLSGRADPVYNYGLTLPATSCRECAHSRIHFSPSARRGFTGRHRDVAHPKRPIAWSACRWRGRIPRQEGEHTRAGRPHDHARCPGVDRPDLQWLQLRQMPEAPPGNATSRDVPVSFPGRRRRDPVAGVESRPRGCRSSIPGLILDVPQPCGDIRDVRPQHLQMHT